MGAGCWPRAWATGWCTRPPRMHLRSGLAARGAVLRDGGPVPLPGADLDGFVIVGCDPALGLAAAMLPDSGPRRVVALSGSTVAALDAMADGRAHGALVHGSAGTLPALPPGVMRLHLARWRVGVASRGRRAPGRSPSSARVACEWSSARTAPPVRRRSQRRWRLRAAPGPGVRWPRVISRSRAAWPRVRRPA